MTDEAVYNPFDVLLLFQKRQFPTWWFETTTLSFWVEVRTERQVFVPCLEQLITSAQLLSAFDGNPEKCGSLVSLPPMLLCY